MSRKNNSHGGAAALGLAALAAAAAGAYYFYGSKAATSHRNKMKAWVLKAQADVMEKMEMLQDVTKEGYEKTVNQVMDKYKKVKNIPPEELAQMAKEMKSHWSRISGQLKEAMAKTKKR